jgi:hypothetical protein
LYNAKTLIERERGEKVSGRGFAGLRQASEEIKARRESGGNWVNFLKVADGQSVRVRFLEQGEDVAWCWMHQLPPKANQKYGDNEPCLNQNRDGTACPGCEQGLRRIVNWFINVIARDAPVWKREENGRLSRDANNNFIQEGTADQIFVWKGGITIFEELDGLDATYRGLSSRDFVITRKGTELSTKYLIQPAVDDEGNTSATPMSDADVELAANKHDLKQFTTPAPYAEWGTGKERDSAQQPQKEISESERINPFLKER